MQMLAANGSRGASAGRILRVIPRPSAGKRPQPVFSYLRRAKRSWKQLLVERRLAGSNPTLTPGAVTTGDCRVSSGFWEGHDAVGRAFLLLFLRSSFAEFLQ